MRLCAQQDKNPVPSLSTAFILEVFNAMCERLKKKRLAKCISLLPKRWLACPSKPCYIAAVSQASSWEAI